VSMPAISEDDLAQFLARTPGFFERHAELLAGVQLTSPHGKRAVSLQERQLEVLRERIRGLERQLVEMIRHGQENVAIGDRLHRWTRALMLTPHASDVPEVLLRHLQEEFLIPQAAVRLWGVDPAHTAQAFAQSVSDDVKAMAADLKVPSCGVHGNTSGAPNTEAAQWLGDASTVASMALLPLKHGPGAVGLLVLGSPDPTRFSADMGTDFLARIADVASAAVARLVKT
jgi:uncharacterized protein